MVRKSVRVACIAAAGASLVTLHPAKADDIECWLSKPSGKLIDWTPARKAASEEEDWTRSLHRGTVLQKATPILSGKLQDPPYKFIGQLFYDKDGSTFNASAEFYASDVLITAAHNLKSGKGVAANMTFIRTSPSDEAANTYQVVYGAYLKDWLKYYDKEPSDAATSKDYAVVFTATPFKDGGLTAYKGGNIPADVEINVVSYAGNKPKYMAQQQAVTKGQKEGAYSASPSGFSPGASGGAWLTTKGDLFSVHTESDDVTMWSPVIDMARLPDWIEIARQKCKPSQ